MDFSPVPELNIQNKQSLKIHVVEAGKEFDLLMVFWVSPDSESVCLEKMDVVVAWDPRPDLSLGLLRSSWSFFPTWPWSCSLWATVYHLRVTSSILLCRG